MLEWVELLQELTVTAQGSIRVRRPDMGCAQIYDSVDDRVIRTRLFSELLGQCTRQETAHAVRDDIDRGSWQASRQQGPELARLIPDIFPPVVPPHVEQGIARIVTMLDQEVVEVRIFCILTI